MMMSDKGLPSAPFKITRVPDASVDLFLDAASGASSDSRFKMSSDAGKVRSIFMSRSFKTKSDSLGKSAGYPNLSFTTQIVSPFSRTTLLAGPSMSMRWISFTGSFASSRSPVLSLFFRPGDDPDCRRNQLAPASAAQMNNNMMNVFDFIASFPPVSWRSRNGCSRLHFQTFTALIAGSCASAAGRKGSRPRRRQKPSGKY